MPTTQHRGMRVAIGLLLAMTAIGPLAQGELLVAFTYEPRAGDKSDAEVCARQPAWPVENYGITPRRYNQSTYERGLLKDLRTARLFVFAGSGSQAAILFKDPAATKALSLFFKNGGVMVCPYQGMPLASDPHVARYFDSIGVKLPDVVQTPRALVKIPAGAEKEPLLSKPNDLVALLKKPTKLRAATTGYFKNVDKNLVPLMVETDNPEHVGWLIQRNILEAGTIILTRSSRIYHSARRTPYKQILENILTCAYGKLADGQTADLTASRSGSRRFSSRKDPFITQLPVDRLNPLYLRNLVKKPWWNPAWSFRMPMVVRDTLGIDRRRLLVEVVTEFPAETDLSSIRVTTAWGEELPSQSRMIDEEARRIEVVFASDFLAFENRCFFIYFDNTQKPDPGYSYPDLTLTETDTYYILANNRIKAKLFKHLPHVVRLEPRGSDTGNQFVDDYGLSPHGFGSRFYGIRFDRDNPGIEFPDVTVDNGPVRKTVTYRGVYKDEPMAVALSMESDNSVLSYAYMASKRTGLSRDTRWLPGEGRNEDIPDHFYYPGKTEIKKLKISGDEILASLKQKEFGEGWYAFEDTETGQAVGELFDVDAFGFLTVATYGNKGYRAIASQVIAPPTFTRGAFVSLPDASGFSRVREEYLAFKHPPEVAVADVQRKTDCPAHPTVPEIGKEQVRAYVAPASDVGEVAIGYAFPEEPAKILPHLLNALKSQGANGIFTESYRAFWKTKYAQSRLAEQDFLGDLIRDAHQDGVSVLFMAIGLRGKWFWGEAIPDWKVDWVHCRDHVRRAVEELAHYDFDLYLVMDESVYVVKRNAHESLPRVKREMQEKYGCDPVMKVEIDKLTDPAHHNTVFYQMDTFTDIIRDMTETFRKHNTRAYVGNQVNPSSMTRIFNGAPHDWERHSDFLNTMCMDLYGKPKSVYKYFVKFMRAMLDNKGPVTMVGGCGTPDKQVIANLGYSIMWGVDVYNQFGKRGHSDPRFYDECKRAFKYMEYTGVGDLMAAWAPQKRVAILWDRAGLIHSIRNGLWGFRGSEYDVKVQNMCFVKNLQTDIVMSKYCTAETLGQYPLVWVVDNPVISDRLADAIGQYVKNGGTALVEAQGIKNHRLQELCGVTPTGELTTMSVKQSPNTPFSFLGHGVPVKANGADTMARLDAQTAIYTRKVGTGNVIYVPLVFSEKAGQQSDISRFVKSLITDRVGPQVLRLGDEVQDDLDSNIFTDGKDYLLAVYNPSFEEKTFTVTSSGDKTPRVLGDFATGEVLLFGGETELSIGSGQIKHFYFGDREGIEPSANRRVSRTTSISYSASPGKELVAYTTRQDRSPAASAPKRERLRNHKYIGILTDRGKEDKRSDQRVTGDIGIFNALQDRDAIKAEYVWDLKPETLRDFDAVIVPNIGSGVRPSVMQDGWEKNVRDYVLAGGAAVLIHHAVGYVPCDFPAFPEVGKNAIDGVVVLQDMRISAAHPVTDASSKLRRFPERATNPAFQAQLDATAYKVEQTFKAGFIDYVPLSAGPNGKVLAISVVQGGKGGDPILVAGKAGKGKVLLSGIGLGEGGDFNEKGRYIRREGAVKAEENLLVNMAYWLTER